MNNEYGRIFCSAKNRALRGSALTRSGPGYAVAKPLQSLAHEPPHPKGWIIRPTDNLAADFELIDERSEIATVLARA
jgi:hypothetical protein